MTPSNGAAVGRSTRAVSARVHGAVGCGSPKHVPTVWSGLSSLLPSVTVPDEVPALPLPAPPSSDLLLLPPDSGRARPPARRPRTATAPAPGFSHDLRGEVSAGG